MIRKVFMNGNFVPEYEAKLSIYDSALMFGDMVFEMTRSFNGVQFKLEEHIERLFNGLKILEIEIPYDKNSLLEICRETQEINKDSFASDDEHRLMIDVSRGTLGIYRQIENIWHKPNVIVADFPLRWTVSGMGKLFDTGINAVITSQRAIGSDLLDPKIKNRSRIHYLKANIEASKINGDNNWALLLDSYGNVTEGTGDNFFIVKKGKIITPTGRNILRGISRQYIMEELAEEIGFPILEKDFDLYDVYTADESFMTGTPFCMLPVTSINSIPIGNGKRGPIFSKLLSKWSQNVGVDIEGQIKKWNTLKNDGPTPYQFRK